MPSKRVVHRPRNWQRMPREHTVRVHSEGPDEVGADLAAARVADLAVVAGEQAAAGVADLAVVAGGGSR